METKLYRLVKSDWVKGLVTAVFGTVIMSLASLAQQPDFNIALVDWNAILQVAIGSFLGYMSKNFFSETKNGEEKVLGVALPQPVTEE